MSQPNQHKDVGTYMEYLAGFKNKKADNTNVIAMMEIMMTYLKVPVSSEGNLVPLEKLHELVNALYKQNTALTAEVKKLSQSLNTIGRKANEARNSVRDLSSFSSRSSRDFSFSSYGSRGRGGRGRRGRGRGGRRGRGRGKSTERGLIGQFMTGQDTETRKALENKLFPKKPKEEWAKMTRSEKKDFLEQAKIHRNKITSSIKQKAVSSIIEPASGRNSQRSQNMEISK